MNRKQAKNHKQIVDHNKGPASKTSRSGSRHIAAWFLSLALVAITTLVTVTFTNLGNVTSNLIGDLVSSTGSPVRINSVHTTKNTDDIHTFQNALVLSDSELSQLNSLNQTNPSYEAWFKSRGTVDTGSTSIKFVVEGNRNHTVRITDIHPIVSCQPPLKGTLFYSPSYGADLSTNLFFDLDNPHAAPTYFTEQNGTITEGKDFFGTHTVSLKQDEQFTFKVVASTKKQFCKFTLVMSVLDEDKTVTETITNDGQPFQVTPILYSNDHNSPGEFSAYQALYVIRYGENLWSRADPNTFPAAP